MRTVIAFDTETHRICKEAVLPKVVTLSLATRNDGPVATAVYGNADPIEDTFRSLLENEECTLVGHATAYDLGVLSVTYPKLIPLIFAALEQGRITCTRVREKLLNISDFGKLKVKPMPDGSSVAIQYSLFELARKYGILSAEELSSTTKEADDSWRINYSVLDGRSAAQYPAEAIKYAANDARWTLEVWENQEFRKQNTHPGPLSMIPEWKTTAEDFAFRIATWWGLPLDGTKIEEVQKYLEETLSPDNLSLLVDSGILLPPEPPRPYKRAKAGGEVKMTKGKPEQIKRAVLIARIEQVAQAHGIPLKKTDPTERNPEGQTSTDSEVIAELAEHDEVLAQYQHRQSQQKVVQEVSKLAGYERCHPNYDVIKETLRTSSFGNPRLKEGEEPMYPSVNIQQQDNRVRGIFIPEPDWLWVSCDYSSLELVSLAQTCLRLFGHSRLAELLLEGGDPHAYLGAQLAYRYSHDFREACGQRSKMDIYRFFQECKKSEHEEIRKFYKHFRTFAKPVGLGYPGGLGARTLVAFAKATYGVDTTVEQATEMKELWLESYPEMEQFFAYINVNCVDPRNEDKYSYATPLGFYRAGASYCAACNGIALQSPSAEGAKLAMYLAVKACYDPTQGSVLYGCKIPGFIHDELLAMIPDDSYRHERAMAVSQIMVEALGSVMPDMKPAIRAEPALMRRWNKLAEPVYDENGRLVVWEN